MKFTKMQGAGNDFIMTSEQDMFSKAELAVLCDRKRGIGADGIIFLAKLPDGRIRFDYYNSDGSPAELCGNGLRCAMEFACRAGMAEDSGAVFATASGDLTAVRLAPELVRIHMPDAKPLETKQISGFDCHLTRIGCPHAVILIRGGLESLDVRKLGHDLRFSPELAPEGANIDFISRESGNDFRIRTYERGVEDETLACGTGVTAAAVFAMSKFGGEGKKRFFCRGGDTITIEFTEKQDILKGLYLTGPAKAVFHGETEATSA